MKELTKHSCNNCISREEAKQFLYERLDRLNDDELYNIFSKIIDDMYNELQPVTPIQSNWIPVDEKLPMNGDVCCDDDVLVSCEDRFVRIGFCMGYDELGNREWCVSADKYAEVEAWMPLPTSYIPDINIGKIRESEGV